jgi:hypothetical protein
VTAPGNAGLKTMLATDGMAPRAPAPAPVPEMAAPVLPKMNTMRIATPLGYSSRPPKKVWPVVLVLGLVLGLGGGAFAVAWFGRGNGSAAAAAADAKQAAVSPTPPPTPTPPPPKPVPPPPLGSAGSAGSAVGAGSGSAAAKHTAVVEITSDPSGADIYSPDKLLLGKTPAKLDLPISDMPVSFELVLAGYKKRTKQIVVSHNTVVDVPLEKMPVVVPNPGGSHKQPHPPPDGAKGLMRPEDL